MGLVNTHINNFLGLHAFSRNSSENADITRNFAGITGANRVVSRYIPQDSPLLGLISWQQWGFVGGMQFLGDIAGYAGRRLLEPYGLGMVGQILFDEVATGIFTGSLRGRENLGAHIGRDILEGLSTRVIILPISILLGNSLLARFVLQPILFGAVSYFVQRAGDLVFHEQTAPTSFTDHLLSSGVMMLQGHTIMGVRHGVVRRVRSLEHQGIQHQMQNALQGIQTFGKIFGRGMLLPAVLVGGVMVDAGGGFSIREANIERLEGISSRRLTRIRAVVLDLMDQVPEADLELILGFARGRQMLAGNQEDLSLQGLALLDQVNRIVESPTRSSMEAILAKLPNVEEPRPELYRPPFTEEQMNTPEFRAFKKLFTSGEGCSIVQIADACFKRCRMCGADAEHGAPNFMAYHRILGVMRSLGHQGVLFHHGNDSLQYRDFNADADLGDVARWLRYHSILPRFFTTHGHIRGEYMPAAARKCRESGLEFFALSIDMFDPCLTPRDGAQMPSESVLERHAQRIVRDICEIQPRQLTLLSNGYNTDHPWLGYEFLRTFYLERIFPALPLELRSKYRFTPINSEQEAAGVEEMMISPMGRAFDDPLLRFNPFFYRVDSFNGYGTSAKIMPDGILRLLFSSKDRSFRRFEESQSIGSRYPDPNDEVFHDALLRLFYLHDQSVNDTSSKADPTIDLWQRFFGFRFLPKISGQRSYGDIARLAEPLHARFAAFPIVTEPLHYSMRVKDLWDGQRPIERSPFRRYLRGFRETGFAEMRFLQSFEEGFNAVFDLAHEYWGDVFQGDQPLSISTLRDAFNILSEMPVLYPHRYDYHLPAHATSFDLSIQAYANQ